MIINRNGQSQRASLGGLRKRIEHYSYCTHERLGSGYSSEVFRGEDDRTGKTIAIKVVNLQKVREKGQLDLLMREIQLLQGIKHQNLVSCLDALMTNNNCYIVTQYCADGDLNTLLLRRGRLGVDEALKLIIEVVAALCHLHQRGVIHRDIKPHNILIHKNRPKLADLGFAIQCETSVRDGYKIGSPLYMSPQALEDRDYSRKSDVWALGVTMYQLFEGRAPWAVKAENELQEAIKKEVQFKHLRHSQLIEVIKGCLVYSRDRRLTMEQVLIRLQKIMGVENNLDWGSRSNKENVQSENQNLRGPQSQEVKKSISNNYSVLKWMVNYSRFVAKLLPKINNLLLDASLKEPLIEFSARCLHMTISKLKKLDQYHSHLGLENYEHFKRTHRFARIKAVTEEYHHKYFMILAKLPYKYYLSDSMSLELSTGFVQTIQRMTIDKECSPEHLIVVQSVLLLAQTNFWARGECLFALSQRTNFEKLIQNSCCEFDDKAVETLCARRGLLLQRNKKGAVKG